MLKREKTLNYFSPDRWQHGAKTKLSAIFSLILKNIIEKLVIDGLVNGVGKMVNYSGRQFRLLQSGQVGSYVLLMVLSMVIIFVLQFFLRK